MTRVACIGECMIEMKQAQGGQGGGLFSRGYGGDTLNTAVYLARLGVDVDYITALGDDALSDEMIAGWAGGGRRHQRGSSRLPGKLPGLYMIQTDDKGERRFFHWRENSAARMPDGFARDRGYPEFAADLRYRLSLGDHAVDLHRARARTAAGGAPRARLQGTRIAFDTNFRARGWPDLDVARARLSARPSKMPDIVLASTEDLLPLYPGESNDASDRAHFQPGGGAETLRARQHPAF